MGGVLKATGRIEMSMTRFSFLRLEAEELAALVLATGGGGVARPALVTSSWVPQKRTLVGNTGNSSDAPEGSSRDRASRSHEGDLIAGLETTNHKTARRPAKLCKGHVGGVKAMLKHVLDRTERKRIGATAELQLRRPWRPIPRDSKIRHLPKMVCNEVSSRG